MSEGFEFRPALRTKTSVIIGLAGGTGSGKTYTALLLATGLAGPDGKIAFIDTERGRGLHYAPAPGETADPARGTFAFGYAQLLPPYSPDRYREVLAAADATGADVIVLDSGSHEWEGEGGVLEMQEKEFEKLNYREEARLKSWIRPKMAHRKYVGRAVQSRAHLIVCLRAQEKMKIVKEADAQGKEKTKYIQASDRPITERWEPICEKSLPFEFTISFVLTPAAPGVGYPVKLQAQHRAFFPEGRPIGLEAGRALAAWARGGAAVPASAALTRGEVKTLERLLETAVAQDVIAHDDHEGLLLAIHDKNADAVREGIRTLTATLGEGS